MSVFRITGGKKLKGDLIPQGAKNEALQVLSAVLLTKQPIVIKNIPKIRDVMNLIELLMCLGVKVTQLGTNEYRFQADGFDAKILVQVHDELLLEVNENQVEVVTKALCEEMEKAASLAVLLEADAHSGNTWYEAK